MTASQSIASFDIFDTVLTRAVSPPSALFTFLGNVLSSRGLIAISPERFVHARIQAECTASANRMRHSGIAEIYLELVFSLGLPRELVGQLVNCELEVESELIRPVPGARNRIWQSVAEGKRVIFVSDMYLPSEFLTHLLGRFGLWPSGARCYVSCEHSCSKSSGQLFRKVLAECGAKPRALHHLGNDSIADVRGARRAGCSSELFTPCNPNRYESTLGLACIDTQGVAGALAGASRLARLSTEVPTPDKKSLVEVASGVVAPVLISYVSWILRQARDRGLRRLYFVSRDGQILFEIAKQLNTVWKSGLELKYLYGSRHTWHFAALKEFGPREFRWLFMGGPRFSIRNLLSRLRIAPEEIRDVLARAGFLESTWEVNMSPDDIDVMKGVLLEPSVHALALARARSQREMVFQYLAQEGLDDCNGSAIVDVGWVGELHESLCRILQDAPGAGELLGFFFGLRSNPIDINPRNKVAYFFDQRDLVGYANAIPSLTDLVVLLEMFCSADHGLVIGYERTGQIISPVLQSASNNSVIDWGLETVLATVLSTCDHLRRILPQEITVDLRAVCLSLLCSFWKWPTKPECIAWGSYPFETDQTSRESYPIARALRWSDLQTMLRHGSLYPLGVRWTRACLVLTKMPLALVLNSLRVARRAQLAFGDVSAGRRDVSSVVSGVLNSLRRISGTAT
jgi:predicted HAD superfamily hydrolase